nr:hypothetical protein [Planctomycetota bacterium]
MELLLIFVAGCLSCVMLASWQASLLVGLVLLVRVLLGELLPVRARYLLWGVVLVRLLVPVFPASDFSVFNLAAGITETAGSGDSEFLTTSTANELSVDPSLDGGRTQTSLAQISVTAIQPNESAPAERQSRVRDSS